MLVYWFSVRDTAGPRLLLSGHSSVHGRQMAGLADSDTATLPQRQQL